jgi:RimJ/RimL family protein N-acetyltransferase
MSIDPASGVPVHPSLRGRRVRLEPVTPDHYDYLYELSSHPALSPRWVHRGLPPVYEAFIPEARTGYLAHFIVAGIAEESPLGIAIALGEDFRHGHCQLAVALQPGCANKGIGVEAGSLLLDYVLSTWPFRMVYFQSPAFSVASVSSGRQSHFEVAAVLRSHRYYDGRYWDEHILCVTRDRWERSRLRRRIRADGGNPAAAGQPAAPAAAIASSPRPR